MENFAIECPHCGRIPVSIDSFEYLLLLDRNHGLAQYFCPQCGQPISAYIKLSKSIHDYVDIRLTHLSEKYPSSNFDRFCFNEDLRNEQNHLQQFQEELDKLDSVDEVLEKIELARKSCNTKE